MGIEKDQKLLTAADNLRRQAEERLQAKTDELHPPLTREAMQRLVHELEVHQIELEMQNEELRQTRDEVEKALDKYTDLYDFAPVGYATLDRDGVILATNLTAAGLLDVDRTQLIGRRFAQFVTAAYRPVFADFLGTVFTSRAREVCEVALRNKEDRPVVVQIEALATSSGQECRLALIDITGRRQVEEALRESEARMYQLAGMAVDAIVMLDDSGTVTFCNAAAERMFGCPAAEITGLLFHQHFIPERLLDTEKQGFARFREQGTGPLVGRTTEMAARRKDGSEFSLELSISALKLQGRWHAIGIMRDITERKELEAALRHESTHDRLTGLYNRAFFDEELERFAHGRMFPLSIVVADVNDLKTANDTLGHDAGDTLLRLAARLLLHAFRGEDIVARIGGDEFAILLPETDGQVAEEAVTRIKSSPEIINGLVSIAFGIASAENQDQLEDLLKRGDERMYRDKSAQKAS
ncbi:MAG: diguanylate cyclase [Desulfuromonadales bacterium]|nr:diguanylate cyclase [Desulfuromonadales bacterium]